jgi:hypothetical protein
MGWEMIRYGVARAKVSDPGEWSIAAADPSRDHYAHGPCPACGYELEEPVITSVITTALAEPAAPTRQTRTFHCNCPEPHPQRPPDVPDGCGRFWTLTIVQAGGSFTVEQGDPSLEAASQQLYEAASQQVTALRGSADKWIGGTTALLGLLGVGGVAVGKDAVSSLSTSPKLAVGILAGLAVAAAAAAVILGYAAAYGWPKKHDVSTDEQLRDWYGKRSPDVARKLGRSVISAVAALTLLTAAAGVIWFGTAASPVAKISYRDASNQNKEATVCGPLDDSIGQEIDVQSGENGNTVTKAVPFKSVDSIKALSSC